MVGYEIMRRFSCVSTTFLILIGWPFVSKAGPINPEDFNADDLTQVQDAVRADTTDERDYDEDSYNCYHFARDLQYNLWAEHSIESQLVNIKYKKDGEDHEHNAVKVTIRDKDGNPTEVYIEPQDDEMYTDVESLLQGLDETQEEQIESIETRETGVFFPVVTTYVGNANTHGSLPVSGSTQNFTVKVTVVDAYRVNNQFRRVQGQNVTIIVTHTDGTTSTITGVTDENGEVTGEVSTSVTGNDIVNRREIEVNATIHVLPQENEGQDSRDPTRTENLRLLLDRRGTFVPAGSDGLHPDRPIHLSADGQVALAEFPFFNDGASPMEIQPVFDCRRNCDASDVIGVIFDPPTVTVPPYDYAVAQALITNITAPVGDTIIGQLYGDGDERRLVFMDVYDPASGPPCTPSSTMLKYLGISQFAPPTRVLDTSDCTWASDGLSCELPGPWQEICGLDCLWLDLDQRAIDWVFNELFPCGQGPAGLTVCASPGPPPPGRYACLIAHLEADILESPFTHHQYAFPCDSDGLAFNNYTSGPPWVKDFFIGTDLWFELLGDPGGWRAQVKDPRQGFATVPSDAAFIIAAQELALFVPDGELTPQATFRATAFGHMGSYLLGPWSGRVQPAVNEGDPLFPIATNPIVVRPPYEASNPSPANFAAGIPTSGAHLAWDSGFGSVFSDVRFGATFPPEFAGSTTANGFDPGPLEEGADYYWQVIENQSGGSSHASPVWTFTTKDAPPEPPSPRQPHTILDIGVFGPVQLDVVGDDGVLPARGGTTLQGTPAVGIDDELDIFGVVLDGEPGQGLHFSIGGGTLNITVDEGATAQVVLSLDGPDGEPRTVHTDGLGVLDLTFAGTQRGVCVDVRNNSGRPIRAAVIQFSGTPDDSIETIFDIPDIFADDFTDVELPFADFQVNGKGAANQTGAFLLFVGPGEVTGPADFGIRSIRTMPIPPGVLP